MGSLFWFSFITRYAPSVLLGLEPNLKEVKKNSAPLSVVPLQPVIYPTSKE